MVQHATLTASSEIHVCKGADTATIGQLPFFDGSGGQVNAYSNPQGMCYFVDATLAAPLVITYPSVYTKIAPTTVAAGVDIEVTEGTDAKLTYTGTYPTKASLILNVTLDQSVGANRDIGLKLYKNGSPLAGSEIFTTSPTGLKQLITSIFRVELAENDYIEGYIKNFGGSGNVNIYAYMLSLMGTRG